MGYPHEVVRCVGEMNHLSKIKYASGYHYPLDAEAHYAFLLNLTAPFRTAPMHHYADYKGPWIENLWIERFMNKSLSTFGSFIPLFVQWVDTEIFGHQVSHSYFDDLHALLNIHLRPDVIYVTLSQSDMGIDKVSRSHPNLLVLSAGGYGHVPIPLVVSELLLLPLPTRPYAQEIGFFGKDHHGRAKILDEIRVAALKYNVSFNHSQGPTWKEDMANTRFNLAPRGVGRSSFRLAESVQMGRVPVYLWNDIPWVPYAGSDVSVEAIGFSSAIGGRTSSGKQPLEVLVAELKALSDMEYTAKLQKLRQARRYYTYDGILEQIEQFFEDPFGPRGGYLKCTAFPKTVY